MHLLPLLSVGALLSAQSPPPPPPAELLSDPANDVVNIRLDAKRTQIAWEVLGVDERRFVQLQLKKKKKRLKPLADEALVAEPQWTAKKKALLYSRFDDDALRWTVVVKGKEAVSPSAASDLHPAVSPNESRLAFSSGRSGRGDIYVADARKTNQPPKIVAQGTGVELSPQWSPDGTKVAFLRVTSRGRSLVVVSNVDTAPVETVLADERMSPVSFSWRPDGKEIAFYRRDYSAGTSLNVVSATGGGAQRRLTNVQVQARGPAWIPGPSWKLVAVRSDGSLVTVTPIGDIETLATGTFGHGEVRAADLQGKPTLVFTALGLTGEESPSVRTRKAYLWVVPKTGGGAPTNDGGLPDFK